MSILLRHPANVWKLVRVLGVLRVVLSTTELIESRLVEMGKEKNRVSGTKQA